MPPLTLRQAEALTGKSRTALLKAVQRGRLSAAKDDLGQWVIDPAELHRVYPDMSSPADKPLQQVTVSTPAPADSVDKVQHLEALLRAVTDERDHLRGLANRLSGLLADQRPASQAQPEADPPTARRPSALGWALAAAGGLVLAGIVVLVTHGPG